jgi:hypothetical protein
MFSGIQGVLQTSRFVQRNFQVIKLRVFAFYSHSIDGLSLLNFLAMLRNQPADKAQKAQPNFSKT